MYKTDKQFLENYLNRQVTDDEVFNFSERVSIMIFDGKLTEKEALSLAVKGIK